MALIKESVDPVQKHIFDTLDGDGLLTTALTGGSGVVDDVPDNPSFPYIEIGDTTQTRFRTFQRPGSEMILNLHIYSSVKGYKEANDILGHCDRLLGDISDITLTDFCITAIWKMGSNRFKENFEGNKIIRHVVAVYRLQLLQR